MPDVFSKSKRSALMSSIKSKDTTPEILLRKALFKLGYRYRCNVRTLVGKPDIVLAKYRTAIQVRGCFWHQHNCIDGHIPKSHQSYWQPKLEKNKLRDRRNDECLRMAGWSVIVVWECQLSSKTKLARQVCRITKHLQKRHEKLKHVGD